MVLRLPGNGLGCGLGTLPRRRHESTTSQACPNRVDYNNKSNKYRYMGDFNTQRNIFKNTRELPVLMLATKQCTECRPLSHTILPPPLHIIRFFIFNFVFFQKGFFDKKKKSNVFSFTGKEYSNMKITMETWVSLEIFQVSRKFVTMIFLFLKSFFFGIWVLLNFL